MGRAEATWRAEAQAALTSGAVSCREKTFVDALAFCVANEIDPPLPAPPKRVTRRWTEPE